MLEHKILRELYDEHGDTFCNFLLEYKPMACSNYDKQKETEKEKEEL